MTTSYLSRWKKIKKIQIIKSEIKERPLLIDATEIRVYRKRLLWKMIYQQTGCLRRNR